MNKLSKFKSFTKEEFELGLQDICQRNNMTGFVDVTDRLIKGGKNILERVYMIPTINPSTFLVIYSTVDVRTGRVRESGEDAVRVFLQWKKIGEPKPRKKKLKSHPRIETLFKNLEKTLVEQQGKIYPPRSVG